MPDKRFIEESFPVKEVSAISAKEKNIRHGHISTLHIWWARRPLAASRATAYAALIPAPKDIDEWNEERQFIIDFAKWENTNNPKMIERARKKILKAYGGKPPKVLDPFGGGGSIPLECLRLGCETYSNDLNPVAVLIQKCTLEYPQKYGKPGYIEREVEEFGKKKKIKQKVDNVLLEDVKFWGNWILKKAKKELVQFYPNDPDGSVPIAYIWARTIPCQNPSCGVEIPLMRQFWLAKKTKRKVALFPSVNNNKVEFKIVGDAYGNFPSGFKPENGTVNRAIVTCPLCGNTIDAKTTKKLFHNYSSSERLVAVVTQKPGISERKYRIANNNDYEIFKLAYQKLKNLEIELETTIGINPIPDESLPIRGTLGFRIQAYNMKNWGDLFNSRQKLSLLTFIKHIRSININSEDKEYSKAVKSYLGISLSRVTDYTNNLCQWNNVFEITNHMLNRNALPFIWDYSEINPITQSVGSWESMAFRSIWKVIDSISNTGESGNVSQMSANKLSYEDNSFDAVFTDPPYYDNIPYSYLSDFFYVWLKRILNNDYPELFSTPLTPKRDEIVAYSNIPGGFDAGKKFFEDMLKKSFQEIFRILKNNGTSIIVYAHKSTEGWETLINSLIDSGLIVTSAWPLNTEKEARLRASESAALASSIYIISRKYEKLPTKFYQEIKEELKLYLSEKLDKLWADGISGADFFIAAIGSSLEVYSKYVKVIDFEGREIRADKFLQEVRVIVTDYAVRKILHNGFASEISDLTRFYVLTRWEFGSAKIPFDEANKLSHSCSIDLANEWNKEGFIKKDKEFVSILGPQDRKIDQLKNATELIDVLHYSLLLWEKSKRNEIIQLLTNTGYGKSEAFYRVAQAISETLPNESKEKKLLDGFLNLRERLTEETGPRKKPQGDLFEE
jgi:adenine-specific DNA methylase